MLSTQGNYVYITERIASKWLLSEPIFKADCTIAEISDPYNVDYSYLIETRYDEDQNAETVTLTRKNKDGFIHSIRETNLKSDHVSLKIRRKQPPARPRSLAKKFPDMKRFVELNAWTYSSYYDYDRSDDELIFWIYDPVDIDWNSWKAYL